MLSIFKLFVVHYWHIYIDLNEKINLPPNDEQKWQCSQIFDLNPSCVSGMIHTLVLFGRLEELLLSFRDFWRICELILSCSF